MTTVEIKSRWTGKVIFAATLEAEHDNKGTAYRRGLAVKLAIKNGADLTGADLTGADLRGADLTGADLTNAYLIDANLRDAYLTDANLRDADLTNANLIGADLINASLTGASLMGADLTGADLRGADLTGADLMGADLTGVPAIIPAGWPDNWYAFGWLKGGEIQVRVGCRSMSLIEGRAYWNGKPDRREVLAALDYIEAVAQLRGWTDG